MGVCGVVGESRLSFLGFCREGKERASVGETRERGKERREGDARERGEGVAWGVLFFLCFCRL